MEFARYEHETEHLRNQLRMREANRDQAKSNWEQKEKHMQAMMQQVHFNAFTCHTSEIVFKFRIDLDIILWPKGDRAFVPTSHLPL